MAQVVVIEDEALLRQTLIDALELDGHTVRGAADGKLGLELLEDHAAAVVVTDLFMPELDGVELIRTVRKRFAGVKVVAISGGAYDGQVQLLDLARGLGAAAVLKKPFELDEFLRVVNTVLGEEG